MKTNQTVKLYPPNIEEKLGFDKIKNLLIQYCKTDLGKQRIDKLSFLTDSEKIHVSIKQIGEIGLLTSSGYVLQLPENLDFLIDSLQKLDIEGTMLYEDELQQLFLALTAMQSNYNSVIAMETGFVHLKAAQAALMSIQPAINIVGKVIDKEGKLKSDASPELWKINKQISSKEKDVRKILLSKYNLAKQNGWAGDTEITIRNERLVIPIIAEHKKKIQGFVHDDSQSGKFLYIEPIECFEENNALKELSFEKKKEIERILKQITAELSPYKQIIWQHIQHTVFLDTTYSKSILASKLNAIEPIIAQRKDDINLINARHPLLYLLLQKDNKKLIPLNFHVDEACNMVIISGPNAGGKSIALKTIGLLQYMYQSGMPVPVDHGSKMPYYHQLFIDIGDNQSIENNLSSYSSHLMNMKFMMANANSETLYLIDELGNGTDPSIGSTIAQAILENLLNSNAFGVVTTHFGNLKAWAGNTRGVQNARMVYDVVKLEPLFVLELGKPGSSFALEVSSKVGIDKSIIERAKKISQWKQQIDLEELIAENEKNKAALTDANKRIADREGKLNKLIEDYTDLKDKLSENKEHILNEAKAKASEIVTIANQRIEKTIQVIQQAKADKHQTKNARKELSDFKETLVKNESIVIKPKQTIVKSNEPLKVGDMVKQNDNNVSGEILAIKKEKAQVLFGAMKMWVALSELHKTSKTAQKKESKIATFDTRLFEKQSSFSLDLDVRGVRGEEAILKLQQWLEDAHLLGHTNLKVVHGRGFGILRKLILEQLKSNALVKHFEHESDQLGGDGVTLVRLK
ncbi:MAG: Smr/MutS family protein [bacterium]|nr:Smr/MutS family protein [bacterium]